MTRRWSVVGRSGHSGVRRVGVGRSRHRSPSDGRDVGGLVDGRLWIHALLRTNVA
jgi:hypothetical protein